MLKRIAFAAAFLLSIQICNVVVAQEAPPVTLEDLSYLFIVNEQAEMEKCYGLPDGKPKECAADSDSDDCHNAEKKPKDGSEFKYVPRDACAKLGGEKFLTKHSKPKK
jgi:uncharacterized membrane protein